LAIWSSSPSAVSQETQKELVEALQKFRSSRQEAVKAYRDQVGEMAAFWDLGMIGAQKRWDGKDQLACRAQFVSWYFL